ncbi:MAG: hypothetical protein J6P54_03005 [Bacteroidales bacterium]|nr:hypothetical protein [Bacteroidales bacterium]
MNKLRILLILFLQATFAVSLNGQNGPCFRFVDTLYLKANVLHVWHATCVCPSLSCVVRDDSEKEIALSLFSGESHFPEEAMPPLLIHTLADRQFVLMRNYLEDSLSNRFTWKQIRHSLEDGIHIDTTEKMDHFREEVIMKREHPDQQFYDSVHDVMIEWLDRILEFSEEELSFGDLRFEGNGKLNPRPSDDAPIDTIVCNGDTYCLKESPFESWGILVEVQNECNFFYYDTAEMDLLQHHKFKKITIFVPLKEKEPMQE